MDVFVSILCVKYWINCVLHYKTASLRQLGERVSPQLLPSLNYKTSQFALHTHTASTGLQFRYHIWVSQFLVRVLIQTQQNDENRTFRITNLDFPLSIISKTTSAERSVVSVFLFLVGMYIEAYIFKHKEQNFKINPMSTDINIICK